MQNEDQMNRIEKKSKKRIKVEKKNGNEMADERGVTENWK